MKTEFCVVCPHCGEPILISKIHCGIFRHGFMIKTKKQIPSHTTKTKCDELILKKMIYGCGKPFQIRKDGEKNDVSICEYI